MVHLENYNICPESVPIYIGSKREHENVQLYNFHLKMYNQLSRQITRALIGDIEALNMYTMLLEGSERGSLK